MRLFYGNISETYQCVFIFMESLMRLYSATLCLIVSKKIKILFYI